jgi:hypothetical protein
VLTQRREEVGRNQFDLAVAGVGLWSCPGLVDTSVLDGDGRPFVAVDLDRVHLGLLIVSRGEVAEGGVAAPRVVEAFDEVEDLEPGLVAGLEGASVYELRLEGGEEALGERVEAPMSRRGSCGGVEVGG